MKYIVGELTLNLLPLLLLLLSLSPLRKTAGEKGHHADIRQ